MSCLKKDKIENDLGQKMEGLRDARLQNRNRLMHYAKQASMFC